MKYFTAILFIIVSGAAFAGDISITRNELMEIAGPTVVEEVCSENIMGCLGLEKASCTGDVMNAISGGCVKHIPGVVTSMESVKDVTKSLASCVTNEVIGKHKKTMMKNINTPACQALMQ